MKYPYGQLSDQQARDTFFVVPDVPEFQRLALGNDAYRTFVERRTRARALGGDVLVIGWPDGTTITYRLMLRGVALDPETLAQNYQASAALHRAQHGGPSV